MIHVFHGFLGSPDDFAFLKQEGVILHDLYQLETFPKIGPEDTLIGYSMGGRIALEIANSIDYSFKKIILINAHSGLSSEKDKLLRKDFENSLLQRLKDQSSEEFLQYWNKLPLFLFDKPLMPLDESRYSKSPGLFNKYRLSNQENHLAHLIHHLDKVTWIIGTLDDKYLDLAKNILEPNGIRVHYIEGGHRLFQKEDEILTILELEGVL